MHDFNFRKNLEKFQDKNLFKQKSPRKENFCFSRESKQRLKETIFKSESKKKSFFLESKGTDEKGK